MFIDNNSGIANYVDDDAIPYKCGPYYDKSKESDNLKNIWWFKYNNFDANNNKCHFSFHPISLLPGKTSMIQLLKALIQKLFWHHNRQ